jgi:hypothetical protein
MKVTPWIAATVLTLGLSPALQAQYRGYPSDRPNQGYRWDGERTYTLAHEVDETATYIRSQMERNNRRPDRNEARALAALYELDRTASRFHRSVESYRRDSRRTDAEFRALVRAFDNAADSLRWIEPRSYVDRGMDRIASLLTEMSRYYGRTYSYHGREWGRDGRYGRDRFDRNGRDRYDRDRDGRYDRDRDDRDRDHDGYRPPVR